MAASKSSNLASSLHDHHASAASSSLVYFTTLQGLRAAEVPSNDSLNRISEADSTSLLAVLMCKFCAALVALDALAAFDARVLLPYAGVS